MHLCRRIAYSCQIVLILGHWCLAYENGSDTYAEEEINSIQLSPIIYIPGYGGSQVNAKLNKKSALTICQKKADWFNLWLDLPLLIIPAVYCFVDNFRLVYNNVSRSTCNVDGVDIQIPSWGDPEVVEWIDPTHNSLGGYFKDISTVLIELGYKRGSNVFGAPYDFRKAANEHENYFTDLKALVEQAYYQNSNTPVTFISHSMGSLMLLAFLQRQTSEWKSIYVQRMISLSGAWAGSMKALKVFAIGDDLDSFAVSGKILKPLQISNPSTAWLLPSPLFWGANEILVETPNRVYTMSQLEEYFNDIGYPTGWEMRKDLLHYVINFSPPGVELYCLYGDGVNTVARLKYDKADVRNSNPTLIMGLGDGTVNRRSLMACKYWSNYQDAPITTLAMSGVNHMDILKHPDILNYIKRILLV